MRLRMSALAVLCAVFLSSCSGLVATTEPVTISFVYPQYGDIGQYQTWATQFQEKYPYITIELVDSEAAAGDVLTRDTFVADQFSLSQYVQQQAILSLDAFIEQDENLDTADFYPAALQVFSIQGRQWALPSGIDMLMMYYNKDLFDRNGVAYPEIGWTWADFLDRAFLLTDPDDDIYAYALHYDDEFAVYEPIILIYQHGGRIFDSLQNPTMVTLDDPLNIEAMEYYAALIHDHRIAPNRDDVAQMGRPYPWRGVFEGRFAMWTMMYSNRGGRGWPVEWEMNWGVVPLPADETGATLATATGLYISAQSPHPEEAWMWIEYVSQQTPPLQMPARISQTESKGYEETAGYEAALAVRAGMEDAILVNPSLMGFESAIEAMAEAFTAIRNGDATPEVALDAAQNKVDN